MNHVLNNESGFESRDKNGQWHGHARVEHRHVVLEHGHGSVRSNMACKLKVMVQGQTRCDTYHRCLA